MKNKSQKIFVAIIAFIMVIISLSLNSYVSAFSDVPNYRWSKKYIDYTSEKGLMNGVGNNLFNPTGKATRAQVVQVLYNMDTLGGVYSSQKSISYTDVEKGAWYYDAVVWAASNGVTNGTSAKTFSPDAKITREQVATLLYNYEKISYRFFVNDDLTITLPFRDTSKISSWAKEAVTWCYSEGILTKKIGNRIDPKGYCTREELATIIAKYAKTRLPEEATETHFVWSTDEEGTPSYEVINNDGEYKYIWRDGYLNMYLNHYAEVKDPTSVKWVRSYESLPNSTYAFSFDVNNSNYLLTITSDPLQGKTYSESTIVANAEKLWYDGSKGVIHIVNPNYETMNPIVYNDDNLKNHISIDNE